VSVVVAISSGKLVLHREPVQQLFPIICATVKDYIDFCLGILYRLPIATVFVPIFLATGRGLYFHCYFNWLRSAKRVFQILPNPCPFRRY